MNKQHIFSSAVFILVAVFALQTGTAIGQEESTNKELINKLSSKIYTQPDHGLEDLQASVSANLQFGGQGKMNQSYDFYWKKPDKRALKSTSDENKGGMGGMGSAFKNMFLSLSNFAITRDFNPEDFGDSVTAKEKDDGYVLTVKVQDNTVHYIFNKEKAPTAIKLEGKSIKENPELSISTEKVGEEYLITSMSGQFSSDKAPTKMKMSISINFKDVTVGEGKTVKVGNKIEMESGPANSGNGDEKKKGPSGGSEMPAKGAMSSIITFELSDIKANSGLGDDVFSDEKKEENDSSKKGENKEEGKAK